MKTQKGQVIIDQTLITHHLKEQRLKEPDK